MYENPFLIIWGASGHAMVVADIVRLQGQYQIFGFLDNISPERHGTRFCGAQILGGEEQLDRFLNQGINRILLGFGDCNARWKLTIELQSRGFSLPVAVHPRATVAGDVDLGPGTVIAAGAVVNPGSRISRSVIVNTSASVDHECVIADAAHICPGVHLAGRVRVGVATHVGIGATVIERISIGSGSVIGAGSVVVDDIPDGVVAYGAPAKVVRKLRTV
ncbi:MAG: acetyltransferase [Anaerolineae bacterium]|nr:acetyltransferase [Anaerolineae bacterium]